MKSCSQGIIVTLRVCISCWQLEGEGNVGVEVYISQSLLRLRKYKQDIRFFWDKTLQCMLIQASGLNIARHLMAKTCRCFRRRFSITTVARHLRIELAITTRPTHYLALLTATHCFKIVSSDQICAFIKRLCKINSKCFFLYICTLYSRGRRLLVYGFLVKNI